MLRGFGCVVDVAGNGQEALELLANLPYDLILMDVQMPVLDGLEATRIIRAGEVERHIPIIAVTAHASAVARAECLAAGMDDCLSKPIDSRGLRFAISSLLESSTPAADAHLVNAKQARQVLAGLGDDALFTEEILELFEVSVRDHLALLELQWSDLNEVRRTAHGLKGVCAQVGAERMAILCQELEERAGSDDLQSARRIVDDLIRLLPLTTTGLRAVL